jgi:regulator of cell morphogenesis and NO signaling
MSERVARVHGEHTPSLVEIFNVFSAMAQELANHVRKEEELLFPAIASVFRGERSPESIEAPILRMITEHEDAGSALAQLRELSNGYQPPERACNTYRALFDGLRELEEDLHRHIHLENAVLFPAVRSMVAPA